MQFFLLYLVIVFALTYYVTVADSTAAWRAKQTGNMAKWVANPILVGATIYGTISVVLSLAYGFINPLGWLFDAGLGALCGLIVTMYKK